MRHQINGLEEVRVPGLPARLDAYIRHRRVNLHRAAVVKETLLVAFIDRPGARASVIVYAALCLMVKACAPGL